jgi:hypothetical protein
MDIAGTPRCNAMKKEGSGDCCIDDITILRHACDDTKAFMGNGVWIWKGLGYIALTIGDTTARRRHDWIKLDGIKTDSVDDDDDDDHIYYEPSGVHVKVRKTEKHTQVVAGVFVFTLR